MRRPAMVAGQAKTELTRLALQSTRLSARARRRSVGADRPASGKSLKVMRRLRRHYAPGPSPEASDSTKRQLDRVGRACKSCRLVG